MKNPEFILTGYFLDQPLAGLVDLAQPEWQIIPRFWEIHLNQWDMAAGALMIKEAGGLVSDFHGGENYLDNGNIIAGNPKIFKNMLQIILPSLQD